MLDQNTDRIYWVIGAVIVVGGLIFAAIALFGDGGAVWAAVKSTLNELLAKVSTATPVTPVPTP